MSKDFVIEFTYSMSGMPGQLISLSLGSQFGFLYIITHTQKQKKFLFTNSYILVICSWMISLSSCKKPRSVDFELNSVVSLSYKISFADLRSLCAWQKDNLECCNTVFGENWPRLAYYLKYFKRHGFKIITVLSSGWGFSIATFSRKKYYMQ